MAKRDKGLKMSKFPSEIFGYHHTDKRKKARECRQKFWCPYVDLICYKKSRLLDFPFGVCTAHVNETDIALCPRRFLENNTIFKDIAQHHFESAHDILIFPEVHLKNTGSFDFVMVKHKPMSVEIEDFIAIEFQTGQTTSTGHLVQGLKDYLSENGKMLKKYNFGLNMYDIWKRTFTQILNKGIIFENWNKKLYWVIQDQIYHYFEKRYNLQDLKYDDNHTTVFKLYDLKPHKKSLTLNPTRTLSASIDELFRAFRNNPNIPPVENFLKRLKMKIEAQAQLSLNLNQKK